MNRRSTWPRTSSSGAETKEHNIKITIDKAAKRHLAEQGFDPEFGARPLKRTIQKLILDTLADKIIRGEVKDGSKVRVNYKSDTLVFTA